MEITNLPIRPRCLPHVAYADYPFGHDGDLPIRPRCAPAQVIDSFDGDHKNAFLC